MPKPGPMKPAMDNHLVADALRRLADEVAKGDHLITTFEQVQWEALKKGQVTVKWEWT